MAFFGFILLQNIDEVVSFLKKYHIIGALCLFVNAFEDIWMIDSSIFKILVDIQRIRVVIHHTNCALLYNSNYSIERESFFVVMQLFENFQSTYV